MLNIISFIIVIPITLCIIGNIWFRCRWKCKNDDDKFELFKEIARLYSMDKEIIESIEETRNIPYIRGLWLFFSDLVYGVAGPIIEGLRLFRLR